MSLNLCESNTQHGSAECVLLDSFCLASQRAQRKSSGCGSGLPHNTLRSWVWNGVWNTTLEHNPAKRKGVCSETFKSQHKRTPVFCKKCVPPNASWWSAEGAVTQFTQCLQHLENITNTINYAIGQITGLHWDLFCQACKGAVHTWANRWCSPLTTVVCVVPHKRREVWGIGMASQWVLQTMDRGLSKPQFGGT